MLKSKLPESPSPFVCVRVFTCTCWLVPALQCVSMGQGDVVGCVAGRRVWPICCTLSDLDHHHRLCVCMYDIMTRPRATVRKWDRVTLGLLLLDVRVWFIYTTSNIW